MTESSQDRKSPSQSNSYLKYSGLAIQLLAAIGFFGWLGYLLDQYMEIKFPVFTLLFGFLAFGAMMFQIYRTLNRDN
jgi:F0F1-type ATP synthase assembly protein I